MRAHAGFVFTVGIVITCSQTRHLMKQLNAFFETIVEVPRIRVGTRQTIETLINEEALLLAKFLRNERDVWTPRLPKLYA